jgi:hypothetical protein
MIEKGMKLNTLEHNAIFEPDVLATTLSARRIRAFNKLPKTLM